MNVHLTFDIEVWCNGWDTLDETFDHCYPRYVYGRSRHGDYALPKTLEILNRHGLQGVFFVEPLFSARFGDRYLEQIVQLIVDAGQEVQLHIHPEWADEIDPPPIADVSRKRQHLTYYTRDEQVELIAYGKARLEAVLGKPVTAFRAGSYAVNADTFHALAANDIFVDSSINQCYEISARDLTQIRQTQAPVTVDRVLSYPVGVFLDGLNRKRPAQVGACGFQEMRQALSAARTQGLTDFVLVSHNFEMLVPEHAEPDFIVVRRFSELCRFLEEHRSDLPVVGFQARTELAACPSISAPPQVGLMATGVRLCEQAVRRLRS